MEIAPTWSINCISDVFVETKSVGRSSRVSAEELRFQRELEDALRMSADETASSGKLGIIAFSLIGSSFWDAYLTAKTNSQL